MMAAEDRRPKRRTVLFGKLTDAEMERGRRLLFRQGKLPRPQTRGDCAAGPRPCPWVGCRYHLGIHVTAAGTIEVSHADDERGVDLEAMQETCALDVAQRGAHLLQEIGEIMGLTRERVRQIEEGGLKKAKRRAGRFGISQEMAGQTGKTQNHPLAVAEDREAPGVLLGGWLPALPLEIRRVGPMKEEFCLIPRKRRDTDGPSAEKSEVDLGSDPGHVPEDDGQDRGERG